MECLDIQTEDRIEAVHFIVTRAVLDIIIVSLIVSVNAFIVFAIIRYRRHKKISSLSTPSVRFALNLAVADLLVGVSTIYYLSAKYLCSVILMLSHLKYLCLFMFVMIICAHGTSAYTIVAIAVDRYIAVVHALRYRELMNTRTSRLMIAAVWILSVCMSTPILYWNRWSTSKRCDEDLVLPLGYLPVITVLSHCLIMGIVGGFHRRIHCEALASKERHRSQILGVTSLPFDDTRHNRKFSSKSAKVLLLVTSCYIICWTPITVIFFIRNFHSPSDLLDVIYNYFFTFLNINYLFNPVVYSWMNPAVRTAILDVFKSLKFKNETRMGDAYHIGVHRTFPSASTIYSVA